MAKRYHDTELWKKQKWFRRLSPVHKLAWIYITFNCDHAGIWKMDYLSLTEDLGVENFDIKEFFNICNSDFDPMTGTPILKERVMILENGFVWITGFVQYQYENKSMLVPENMPVVQSAFEILNGHGILQQGFDKGFIRVREPLDNSCTTVKNKNKNKNISCISDKEELGGCGNLKGGKGLRVESRETEEQRRDQELKSQYAALVPEIDKLEVRKDRVAKIAEFMANRPTFVEPFIDLWQETAAAYNLPLIKGVTGTRLRKFKARVKEPEFDFVKVLQEIKLSPHLQGDNDRGWKLDFDWIFENDTNYLKIIEGKYRKK